MERLDCIIIGGGPAGLTAALYLARFRRSVMLIDAGESRALLIPESQNYPGFVAGIGGSALLATLERQLLRYPLERRAASVEAVSRTQDGFTVSVAGEQLSARRILLATGIRDIRPALPDHDRTVRDGLLRYCPVCDAYEARDRTLCVIGPLAHAAPKARFLRVHTPWVTLAATDDEMVWPSDMLQDLAALEVPVRRADTDQPLRRSQATITVPLAGGEAGEFDAVYAAMGATAGSKLGKALGAALDEQGLFLVDDKNRTSIEGVYAAGDVVSDLHQISVAIGHAAVAASAINASLPSGRPARP